MEKKLTKLFDYQQFACNPRLQALIDSVHSRRRELDLDDAELVAAAGSPYLQPTGDDPQRKASAGEEHGPA